MVSGNVGADSLRHLYYNGIGDAKNLDQCLQAAPGQIVVSAVTNHSSTGSSARTVAGRVLPEKMPIPPPFSAAGLPRT